MSARIRAFVLVLLFTPVFFVCAEQLFNTRFFTIHYNSDRELSDLVWRLSGKKPAESANVGMASSRVDEIVERVESLLGMYPKDLHVDMYLQPKYESGDVAWYSREKKCITVAVDHVTDGVLAHEIAHAVINSYFDVPPPKQVQEILAQYVDRQLWSD